MKKLLFFFFLLFFTSTPSITAQIAIDDTTYSVEELVQNILLSPDSEATVSNIQFSGVYGSNNYYQISHFTTSSSTSTEMEISEGVLLTTGYSTDITFPIGMNPGLEPPMGHIYDVCLNGQISQLGTCSTFNNDLDVLCGAWPYYNACILEFDFIPNTTYIEFNYVFGSEEYENIDGTSNYQCTEFNDKFGFIISGPNLSGGVGYDNDGINIARLENGTEVSINSVNNGIVQGFEDPNVCIESNPDWVENVAVNQYNGTIDGTKPNGNTKLLTAFQDGLVPNQTYHIKLVIADVSDGWLDSVVYLEGGSFNTTPNCNAGTNQVLCNTTTTNLTAITSSSGSWSVISGTGDFTDATNPNTTVSNLSFGDNVFVWILDDDTCSSQVTITNTPLTEPNFNPIEPICINGPLEDLPTLSTNGISGTWSPELDNTTTTTYTFTPNSDECASNQSLTIIVQPLTPTFDEILSICEGDTLMDLPLTSNNGISGTWSPDLNNMETTTYIFTPNLSCSNTTSVTIEVNQTANFEITSFCYENEYTLQAITNDSISDLIFEWYDSDNSGIGSDSSITVSEIGTYYLEVNNSHCSLVKSIEVTSTSCFIPSGISPNDDGQNDYFDLTGFNVKHLSIFNRYGVKIYEKENYIKDWNGRSKNGKLLPTGTYFYIAEFADRASRIGWVYLNR